MCHYSGHPRKGRVVFVPMSPCPMGIGSLALRTDTLFTPVPCLKGVGVSIYLQAHVQTHDMEQGYETSTLIIPISACYYLELRNAITSYSGVQFILTKL